MCARSTTSSPRCADAVRFYENELVPTRRAITAGMLLQYNGMLVGNYELFITRAEQIEAEHKAIETLRDYWITRAELERAVGGNLRARRGGTAGK